MNTKKNRLITALICLFPLGLHAQSEEPVAIVLAASGTVTATEIDGDVRQLQRRSALYEGDTISTAEQSRVQFRFNDNGRIALQPESSFFIETHQFNGIEDGTETASYELLRGGLQAITGIIGHTNKEKYNVSTPLANIGLRGTHWAATYCEGNDCSGNPPGLYGGVAEGGIDVCNSAGCTAVDAETYFYTPNTTELTQALFTPPSNVFLDSPEPEVSTEGDDTNIEDNSEEAEQPGERAANGTPNLNANQNALGALASESSNSGDNGANQASGSETGDAQRTSQVAEQALEVAAAFDSENSPVNERALERATAFNFVDGEVSESDETVTGFTDQDLEELGNNGNGRAQENTNSNSNAGGNSGSSNSGSSDDSAEEELPDDNTSTPGNSGSSNGNSGNGNGNTSTDTTSNDSSDEETSDDETSSPGNSGNSSGNSGNGNSNSDDILGEGESAAILLALYGNNIEYQSNLNDNDRLFDAFWGRWSGPGSNGNNRNDHFAYSPDVTTSLPTEGSLSYQLLAATSPTDQTGKEGQVDAIEMLIDFTAQSISAMSFELTTGTSKWEMVNSTPAALGDGIQVDVELEGNCFDACAKRFDSIPAGGSTTLTLLGSNAEGALGTYELSAGSATANGAYILQAD